ncbi:MAG: antibiotic biosynthesis monooxygenase [Nitrospinota bacterium]|nr:MAG: antibiotic biosynthesis monooxygenase [Nitrospinota bacterium]
MFVVTTHLRAIQGKEAPLEAALRKLVQHTRDEPGNSTSILYRSLENERAFFLYEVFKDQESFEEHSVSTHFQETMQTITPWLAQSPGIAVYRQIY